MKRLILWLAVVALVATGAWFGWQRTRPTPADLTRHDGPASSTTSPANKVALETPVDLTKHDGQTIDFSSGKPVVKNSPEDQAALDAGARDLAEATKGVTFEPVKKKPEPAPAPPKS